MIDNWFTNKCMTLVGSNGRALAGDPLAKAEQALQDAKFADHKIWTDRNGNFFHKERRLFAPAEELVDSDGNPVRICGKRVKTQAKFCSKCGGIAPGGYWRCGACGKMIGAESQTCPHCGRNQNPMSRLDLNNGCWRKDEDVFAERFDFSDVASCLPKGFQVQESQCAIVLENGAVIDVLESGNANPAELAASPGSEISLVLVDLAEFTLPMSVAGVRTADDYDVELQMNSVLRFDAASAKEFMRNLMGNCMYLKDDALSASLSYDLITQSVLPDLDTAVREFCRTKTLADLFRDPQIRLNLEDHITVQLQRAFNACGIEFIRTKELEFTSEVFDKLRSMSAQVEYKRKEIEFMQRADDLANDAVRREAMSETDMEEFMNQLAHEKGIKDETRVQEIERLRRTWSWQTEQDTLNHEYDVEDLKQLRSMDQQRTEGEFGQEMLDLEHSGKLKREYTSAEARQKILNLEHSENLKREYTSAEARQKILNLEHEENLERTYSETEMKQKILDLEHSRELARTIAAQKTSLEYTQIESQIQTINLEVKKKQAEFELWKEKEDFEIQKQKDDEELRLTREYQQLKNQKQILKHNQNLEYMEAASKASNYAVLMGADDPEKRKDLISLMELEKQENMTPEQLLAAAAARGSSSAAEALSRMTHDEIEVVNRSKNENREIFEDMLKMNERLFNKTADKLAEKSGDTTNNTTNTTQVVK